MATGLDVLRRVVLGTSREWSWEALAGWVEGGRGEWLGWLRDVVESFCDMESEREGAFMACKKDKRGRDFISCKPLGLEFGVG